MPTYSAFAPQRASEPFRPWLELCFRGHRQSVLCADLQYDSIGGRGRERHSCLKRSSSSSDHNSNSNNASSRRRLRVSAAPRVVSCGVDGAVMVWDANRTTRALRLLGHRGAVLGCAFSPQQYSSSCGGAYSYDDNSDDDDAHGGYGDARTYAAAAAASRSLLLASCGQDGYVRLWLPTLRASAGLYPAHGSYQVDCSAHVNSSSSSSSMAGSGVVMAAVAPPREQASVWRAHSGAARALAFAHDGSGYLYTVGDDKALKVWDIGTCTSTSASCVYTGCVPAAGAAAAAARTGAVTVTTGSGSVGGRFVGSFVGDRTVAMANGHHSARLQHTMTTTATSTATTAPASSLLQLCDGHTNWVRCLAVQRRGAAATPGGFRYIASGGDDRGVHVWDVRTRRAAHCFYEPTASVRSLDFHPDGNCLVSADASGTLNVYDLRMSSSSSAALSAHADVNNNGSNSSSSSSISKRKRATFALLQHYAHAHDGAANAVSFSGDGGWLLSAGDDGAVKLWDVREGYLYCTVQAHEGAVKTCRFSSSSSSSSSTCAGHVDDDSAFFVTAGVDKVVMLWRSGLPSHVTPRAVAGTAAAATATAAAASHDATAPRRSPASSTSGTRVVSFADTIDDSDEADEAVAVPPHNESNDNDDNDAHTTRHRTRRDDTTTTTTTRRRQKNSSSEQPLSHDEHERSFARSEERYDGLTREHDDAAATTATTTTTTTDEAKATTTAATATTTTPSDATARRLLSLERAVATLVATVQAQQAAHARELAALHAASATQQAQYTANMAQLRALLVDAHATRQHDDATADGTDTTTAIAAPPS